MPKLPQALWLPLLLNEERTNDLGGNRFGRQIVRGFELPPTDGDDPVGGEEAPLAAVR